MKDIELRNKIVDYLFSKYREIKTFPQEYTPTEIVGEVGGHASRVGFVSCFVVVELKGRGLDIAYVKNVNIRKFIING